METKNRKRLETLRETLKKFYLKNNAEKSAIEVDRLTPRSLVRISKVVFGSQAYAAIKEAI